MTDLLVAFGVVFIAELGDKSMLLALAFATRYRPWPVLAGITIAAVVSTGVATLVGAAVGAALPERTLSIIGGVLFLGFALWLLREGGDGAMEVDVGDHSVFGGVTVALLLAELGDKTTLATAALASTQQPLPTWIGAATGMAATGAIAIVVGNRLGTHLPERGTRLAAAAVFVIVAVLLLADVL